MENIIIVKGILHLTVVLMWIKWPLKWKKNKPRAQENVNRKKMDEHRNTSCVWKRLCWLPFRDWRGQNGGGHNAGRDGATEMGRSGWISALSGRQNYVRDKVGEGRKETLRMTPKILHWEMGWLCHGTRCSHLGNTLLHCDPFTWPTPTRPSTLHSSITRSESATLPDPRACLIPVLYFHFPLCIYSVCDYASICVVSTRLPGLWADLLGSPLHPQCLAHSRFQ